jgi:C1A family cysteine protease
MLRIKKTNYLLLILLLTLGANLTKADDLPASFDWRTVVGNLTPVKSEGQCGAVWAYVLTASMETAILIKEKLPVSLSEQYFVDCNDQGYGCNGGEVPFSMAVTPGFVLESDYPDTGTAGACNKNAPIFRQAQGFGYVAKDPTTQRPTIEAVKRAILNYGAVISTMDAVDNGFENYSSGVFEGAPTGTPAVEDHAVNLIGWNDAGGYWIARNSWGVEWGEQGYFRIKYGANSIGIDVSYLIYNPSNSLTSR